MNHFFLRSIVSRSAKVFAWKTYSVLCNDIITVVVYTPSTFRTVRHFDGVLPFLIPTSTT